MIDESADEPCACNAIDEDAGPSDPGSSVHFGFFRHRILLVEEAHDLVIGCSSNNVSGTDDRVGSVILELGPQPYEILDGILAIRQDVDGVSERNGADSLEPAAQLYA